MRGYQRDSIEGNAYLIANVKFLTPIFGQRSLRCALFMDIDNAYPTVRGVDPTNLKTGIGFGLRW